MDGPPVQEGVQQLEELIHAIDDLRRRVAMLEQRSAGRVPDAELLPVSVKHAPLPEVSSGLLAPIGRLLLGIAGAYLLRAITEAGILPELTGTLVGLLYAAGWLVASIRTAACNRVSVALEGLTASAIAAPLLWEATARFHVMTPFGAAAALALFMILGQIVAWKHDHNAIAAITALAGAGTAVALIITTLNPVPFTVALLIAAAVVEYGAIRDYALSWRWILALASDFCVFLLVYLTTRPQGLPEGYESVPASAVTAVQIALLTVYLLSLAARTIVRRLQMGWFEIVQVVVVVALVITSNLRSARGVGAVMFAAGAACYLTTFTSATQRLRRNFHAYATFGVILLIAAGFLLLQGWAVVALWSLFAVAATWFGCHQPSNTLRMHGAIYLLAAASMSVTLATHWVVTAAAVLAYTMTLWMGASPVPSVLERIPSTLVAALLTWSLFGITSAGLIVAYIDASLASMFRTLLVALIAIALAWIGKRWNLTELIWVLYPWMMFGAGKLFVDDFPQGRPATLSVSLLVYGGTLMALPRLLRRASEAAA